MRTRRVVTVLTALALIAVLAVYVGRNLDRMPLPTFGEGCAVEAEGRVELDAEQMSHAATITAVGVRLGMPDQAVVVALATAFQESKLRNLPHLGERNDHDSVGLFQQRPSQGWGSEEEILDPRYAAERFYRALSEVDGWQEMRLTEAAQRVQRSAFPEAYQRWSQPATVLATALLGQVRAAVTCTVSDVSPVAADPADGAERVGRELVDDWGEQVDITRLDQTRVEVAAEDVQAGWRYAHWLVAHAGEHGVSRVHFADLEWTATRGIWTKAVFASSTVQAHLAD